MKRFFIFTSIMICIMLMFGLSGCKKKITEPSVSTLATVNTTLSTNNGGSVVGAVVRLANNNGNADNVYQKSATSSSVNFAEVERGTYTLTVTHAGYQTFTNVSFEVNQATVSQTVNLIAQTGQTISSINIHNGTNQHFSWGFIRETGTTNWGNDFGPVYNIGSTVSVDLSGRDIVANKRYDIRLQETSTGGVTATKTNLQLSQNGTVSFYASDIDGGSVQTITSININNGSNQSFSWGYIRETGTTNWGNDLGPTYGVGSTVSVNLAGRNISSNRRYDIRLQQTSSGGVTATKTNLLLSQNGTVSFYTSDIDGGGGQQDDVVFTVRNSSGHVALYMDIYYAGTYNEVGGVQGTFFNQLQNGGTRTITIPGRNVATNNRYDIEVRLTASAPNPNRRYLNRTITNGTTFVIN